MPDTYKTGIDAAADRQLHQAFLVVVGASPRALRRDECGAWRIRGERPYLHLGDGNTFVVYVSCGSARAWSAIKKKLAFCSVTQDGNDEGCLRLLELPTTEQAVTIRKALGIRKCTEKSAKIIVAEKEKLARARDRSGTAGNGGPPVEKPARAPSDVPGYARELPSKIRGETPLFRRRDHEPVCPCRS